MAEVGVEFREGDGFGCAFLRLGLGNDDWNEGIALEGGYECSRVARWKRREWSDGQIWAMECRTLLVRHSSGYCGLGGSPVQVLVLVFAISRRLAPRTLMSDEAWKKEAIRSEKCGCECNDASHRHSEDHP